MQRLDPLTFPLTGARLIEASAGTGKTYTIATLYVRLLLGHGLAATSGPLDVDRILVVTFTEAATAELRERIRQRVREALQVFLLNTGDPLLLQLADDFAEQMPWAIRRLKLCLRQMDEAQIYTIHGFCNRLLQRHAFESGTAFDLRFETQDRGYREEAVRDFWRGRILPLDAMALEALAGVGLETPSKLERALRDWSRHEQLTLHQPPPRDLDGVLAQLRAEVDRVAALWPQARRELVPVLESLTFRKAAFMGADLAGVVSALDTQPQQALVKWARYLAPEHLRAHLHKRARTNGGGTVANLEHPFLLACAGLAELAQEPLRQAVLITAWGLVRQRLAELKTLHQVLTPDDLLHKTAEALRGAGGEQLAGQIGSQYPMVLIDEFQDTDPTQYFIFDRLFGRRTAGGLCMIGDPKQAIYAFRGGDIHTYVQAKRALQARDRLDDPHLFTLDVNWRATSGLVRAVNLLFQQVPDVFLSATIPFHPVQASVRADQAPLLVEGQQPSPLTLWATPEDQPAGNKQALQTCLAEATAHQIAHYLNLAAAGRARIGERPLRAGDMAVLVRNQQEGALIQQALGQQGIKSVSIGRSSVFRAPVAVDLYQVLRAVAEPADEQLIRAALGSSLFADSPLRLEERWTDDSQWEALRLGFDHYHRLWMRAGLIPMLRLLLREQGVYARLAERRGWERRLADLFHLAELLQQARQEVRGAQGLLRWFEEAISAADDQEDEQQVRLDQDDDLVQVVTIHKSKGLEYPLAFLPFAWSRRPAALALFHDAEADDRLTLDLAANPALLARADRELLAEDLRLLYVALTRARHQVFLGVAPYQSPRSGGLVASALGHLVFQGEAPASLEWEQLRAALARWQSQADGSIQLTELPAPARLRVPEANRRVARAQTFRGYIPDDWRLASFSSLAQGGDGRAQTADGLIDPETDAVALADEVEPTISIRDFPKGARAGTLMHELLEALDYPTLMPQRRGVHPDLATLVADKLKLHGYEQEPWTGVLCQWLQAVVRTPLGEGLSLAQLDRQKRLSEMEFHLPVGELNATALAEILRQNDPGREGVAPALAFGRVQGQLKGFIDLVCEHQGRYFVLDFKSNHLGARIRDYHQGAMQEAVRRHQYDLQYLFYTVALHRLLRYRLGRAYRYDQHVGGVFCLFLRGMEPDREQPYGVFHQRPPGRLIARLDALLQGQKRQGLQGQKRQGRKRT